MVAHTRHGELSFVPHYYSWGLYDGESCIYEFDDFSDNVFIHDDFDAEKAADLADDLMYTMENSYDVDGVDLDPAFIEDAKKVIAAAILAYYE